MHARSSLPDSTAELGQILQGFSEYLRLLARLQLRSDLAGKVDVSGVVQQTLLEAYQSRGQFPSGAEQQAAWLRRALANNLTDAIRRLGSRGRCSAREQSLEQAIEQSSAQLGGLLASDEPTPRGAAIHQEQLTRLAHALGQLPEDQRHAVELHHLQGLSLVETGQRLDRSREAVAGLVFRGMRKLRLLLADEEGG